MNTVLRPIGLWDTMARGWIVAPTADYATVVDEVIAGTDGYIRAAVETRRGTMRPVAINKAEFAALHDEASRYGMLCDV
jgi:hypothetical protein